MNDSELDALLAVPLPERDAGPFSVALMERIAHDAARPARIAAWIMAGILTVVIAAAAVWLAMAAGRSSLGLDAIALPCTLTFLTLVLSYAVMRSARE